MVVRVVRKSLGGWPRGHDGASSILPDTRDRKRCDSVSEMARGKDSMHVWHAWAGRGSRCCQLVYTTYMSTGTTLHLGSICLPKYLGRYLDDVFKSSIYLVPGALKVFYCTL